MAGTKSGGIKARNTMIELYGEDYFAKIGKRGGVVGTTGGFASNKVGKDGLTGKERAKVAGSKGGAKSTRKGVPNRG